MRTEEEREGGWREREGEEDLETHPSAHNQISMHTNTHAGTQMF